MNIIYDDLDSLWRDTLSMLLHAREHKGRNGSTRELTGFHCVLRNPRANFVTNPVRKMSPIYAAAEMLWYLSMDNIGWIKHYAPRYEAFLLEGIAHGGYGKRIRDQFTWLLKLLRDQPNTRQAVLSIWEPAQDLVLPQQKSIPDVPCTLSLQFLIRDHKLYCITTMRSNDAWLGMPYDVFCFSTLQMLIADELGLNYGEYTHNVGSMHIYERNYEKAIAATKMHSKCNAMMFTRCRLSLRSAIKEALIHEGQARKYQIRDWTEVTLSLGATTRMSFLTCAAMLHGMKPPLDEMTKQLINGAIPRWVLRLAETRLK